MYKLQISKSTKTVSSVMKTNDNGQIWFIPFDPANTDAQQFKIWLQEGNIPASADGETTVTQEEVDAIITLLNG
jgi:hypothetical protein